MDDYKSIWGELRNTSFTQGWIDCGGISTRYLTSGNPDKPPLLLLHGVGGHAEAYVRNLKSHGENYWTWAIDMVGHGWTDKPSSDREISQYIDHVLHFLDALKVDQVHVSGESLGGWVATRLAIDHPDRIMRLVLNTAGGSQADPEVMARLKTLSMRAAQDPNWETIEARMQWLMADNDKLFDDLIATRQAIYRQPDMAQAMAHTMVLQDLDVRLRNIIPPEDYARIEAPTLVVWTSDDPTADVTEGQRIASMIPGAIFTVMDRCGHWPQFENAELFNQMHLNFLEGLPLEQARPE